MNRSGTIGIIAIIAVAVLLMAWFFPQPSPEPLPSPNGYDDFVAAGEMLSEKTLDDADVGTIGLQEFISTNRLALEKGRSGLAKPCRVPTQPSATWKTHMTQMMATRMLARAFCAEGNLARLENRPHDAAESYMTAIRIGAGLAHGGLMIDGLISVACEGQGEVGLASEIRDFDLEQSRLLIKELQEVEAEQEPATAILKHDRRWVAAQRRSIEGLKAYFNEMIEKRSLTPDRAMQDGFAAQYKGRLNWITQLEAKLAAHAYALENRTPPTNWSALVPRYLKAVPDVTFRPDDTNRLELKDSHSTPVF